MQGNSLGDWIEDLRAIQDKEITTILLKSFIAKGQDKEPVKTILKLAVKFIKLSKAQY